MLQQWLELEEQPYTEVDAEWDDFVANHPQGSLLQSTAWARLKNRFGWRSHRVWLRHEGKLIAGAQVLYRAFALGTVRIGYIPHGPLVDWQDEEQTTVLLNQIDQAAYEHRASLVKMEPLLWLDEVDFEWWEALCGRLDLRPDTDTIQPPRTLQIDLRPSEEEILAGMKQKTRYNIRLAERKGVVVREGTQADLPVFNRLMRETGARDSFGIHEPQYYAAAFELFAPEHAALLIAEYEGQPLAGVMAFAYGDTGAYLYGASSSLERQRMPTYAAQWAAIRWAREKGCHTYDMWGVPDYPEDVLEAGFTERTDGLWPVYRFKRGFGGDLRRTVGAADRAYNDLLYRFYRWRRRRNTQEEDLESQAS